MNTLGDTYKLAHVKTGIAGLAGGLGRFLGAVPFWIAGSIAAESLIGKAPAVRRVYVPRRKFRQMRSGFQVTPSQAQRIQQAGGMSPELQRQMGLKQEWY